MNLVIKILPLSFVSVMEDHLKWIFKNEMIQDGRLQSLKDQIISIKNL